LAPSVPLVYEKIKSNIVEFPESPKISDDLKDLLIKILHKNPNERITLPLIKVRFII
jgi:hypothetical protein